MPDLINALLIGGGGREHAIATKLVESPRLSGLWVTHPSNPGLAALGKPVDVPVNIKEIYRLEQFCDRNKINLIIVGPEDPLAEGFADKLAKPDRLVFGPVAAGARLEADKAWAKQIMRGASIPTAEARAFADFEAASEYLRSRDAAQVIKAAGLAKGKGVVVPESLEEGLAALEDIMVKRIYGDAGAKVIIEERLTGPEASVLALVDGRTIYVLEPCQDHKRLGDGDTGPNTGGMGAFCPSQLVDEAFMATVETDVLVPVVDALKREGIHFRGVLYAGLMLTPAGPKVLEFNVRFGDPECQALMARLDSDLLELIIATCQGKLADANVRWKDQTSCCIVLASEGYPANPHTGRVITGIEDAQAMEGVQVFHAGTKRDKTGDIVTSGGRVLNVVGLGANLEEARRKAYAACDVIEFEGKTLRRDIGASPDLVPH